MRSIESSSIVAAGFGTTHPQVAGFHRAVPSTTLDKAYMQLPVYYTVFWRFVKYYSYFIRLQFCYGLFHPLLIK